MTRLLLVDGSDLTSWLVARLIPRHMEIVRVGSFAEADRFLREQPPDAAIFNLTPRHLDWRALIDLCVFHEPVIPFLCCTVFENEEERDGPLPCRPEDYFTKSIPKDEFRALLERLCAESGAREKERFSGEGARCGGPGDRKLDPTPA
jgi:DNA-binding NtrC family response regulator